MPIFGVRAFQGVQNIVTIDPEKSRDFSFKNPGILADSKSRDPGIPGIPLGPVLKEGKREDVFAILMSLSGKVVVNEDISALVDKASRIAVPCMETLGKVV